MGEKEIEGVEPNTCRLVHLIQCQTLNRSGWLTDWLTDWLTVSRSSLSSFSLSPALIEIISGTFEHHTEHTDSCRTKVKQLASSKKKRKMKKRLHFTLTVLYKARKERHLSVITIRRRFDSHPHPICEQWRPLVGASSCRTLLATRHSRDTQKIDIHTDTKLQESKVDCNQISLSSAIESCVVPQYSWKREEKRFHNCTFTKTTESTNRVKAHTYTHSQLPIGQ